MINQEAKLEYLNLLLEQRKQSAEAFNNVVKGFYTFTLVFFIFSTFNTSELSLFGAKVEIPQNVISLIAPIVLSFYYMRLVSLYENQEGIRREVEEFAPQSIRGKTWVLGEIQIKKLTQYVYWFHSPTVREGGILYLVAYILIEGGMILSLFLTPIIIIVFFNWKIWQSQEIMFLITSVSISAFMIIPSLIILANEFKQELAEDRKIKQHKKK